MSLPIIQASRLRRTFGDVETADNGLYRRFASDGGFMDWRQIVRTRLGAPGWQRHWDDKAQAPYLWNPTERRFITYDDPQSLAIKADCVKRNGLGGITARRRQRAVAGRAARRLALSSACTRAPLHAMGRRAKERQRSQGRTERR